MIVFLFFVALAVFMFLLIVRMGNSEMRRYVNADTGIPKVAKQRILQQMRMLGGDMRQHPEYERFQDDFMKYRGGRSPYPMD